MVLKRKVKAKKVLRAAKKKAKAVKSLKTKSHKAPAAKKLLRAKAPARVQKAPTAKAAAHPKASARRHSRRTGMRKAQPRLRSRAPSRRSSSSRRRLPRSRARARRGRNGRRSRKDEWLIPAEMPKEDAETRRTRLKNLIKLGKERGFLTYSEINDHLPDDIVDAEQIEGIIATFDDMGIAVYDQAPDPETLLHRRRRATGRAARRRRRGAGRGRAVHRGLRIRPHHRPGAHVHARDGLGGAAHARRRDRDRQAHRGRPAAHDPGDLRLPDHGRGDPRPRRQGREGRDCASTRWSTA